MKTVKVSGHKNFVRDMNSQAIINTNSSEYEEYKKLEEASRLRETTMVNEINSLKNDISEIKSILKQIVQGK